MYAAKSEYQTTGLGYDAWAPTYDDPTNPMLYTTREQLKRHPPQVEGQNVLEVGCGTGRLIPAMLALGAASYTGVDASARMLARAQKRSHASCVRLYQHDIATPLPMPAATFDQVFIVLVLEHAPSLIPIFDNVARLLRAGGRLRLLEPHPHMLQQGGHANGARGEDTGCLPRHVHALENIAQACLSTGLRVDGIETITADDDLVRGCAKLQKRLGQTILFDLTATKV